MTTTNLEQVVSDTMPIAKLANSCASYSKQVDEILDTMLPAIKTNLQANRQQVEASADFDSSHLSEIDAAIARIDGALGA